MAHPTFFATPRSAAAALALGPENLLLAIVAGPAPAMRRMRGCCCCRG
ncbi:hypothetical protein [Hymenobacter psoromatis]|nr:hypothetical protein [Hymenobacter psoromatis]